MSHSLKLAVALAAPMLMSPAHAQLEVGSRVQVETACTVKIGAHCIGAGDAGLPVKAVPEAKSRTDGRLRCWQHGVLIVDELVNVSVDVGGSVLTRRTGGGDEPLTVVQSGGTTCLMRWGRSVDVNAKATAQLSGLVTESGGK